ncbi:MAG: M12 family metallo-peptidase [Flavobacteriales bacterium]|nr:M12 family metallo-peptidase [Flavobacteriales bacterium]
MKRFFTLSILFTYPLSSYSQSPLWNRLESLPQAQETRYITPERAVMYSADFAALVQMLSTSPMENTGHGKTVEIPTPDGTFEAYEIWEYHMMEEGLRNQFPEIGTYLGRSIDVPSRTIRIDHTYQGFHAQVRGLGGSWFIDPIFHLNTQYYQVYYKRDLINTKSFECGVNEVTPAKEESFETKTILQNGTQFKTYRLAIAATGEYTTFHGGTVALAQSAQVTTMNRVNGVYEIDFSVRMNFIANNNLIIYTNAATDPYTNGDPGTMIGQNQTNLTNVIGGANYDIGHVFGTNSGGLASLGSVCSNTNKARGVTGSAAPINDPFDIDYVAHEIGHQFGGSHTFNSSTGSCGGGNRSASNAYEPGSGITIMAYAGICAADNLAPNSIDNFHARSYDQMRTFITTGNGNNCDVATNTNNAVPLVDAGPSIYHIPLSTPFRMTAVGSDANPGDQLTYCWEQYDLGNSVSLAQNPTSGTHPLFMSFSPDTSATRVFPRMQTIVNNLTDNKEKLPYYGRRLRFRVVVRDNRPNGGAASLDSTTIWAVANTGPFLVTSPNTALSWEAGTTQIVTWDVAGSTANPINCQNVNIKLSTDGGFTYPITILANTPNDGTQSITVPNLGANPVSTCRIMVEAADNIFFDISNANFTIQPESVIAPIASFSVSSGGEICTGGILNFTDNSQNNPSSWDWSFQGGNPSTSNAQNPQNIQFPNAGTFTVSLTVTNTAGSNTTNQSITVNPLPQATFDVTPSFATQSTGSATANPSGGSAPFTIQWATNPVQTGPTANNLAPGSYVVTVTNAEGCFSVFNVDIPGNASVNENEISQIQLYPNPAEDLITLSLPENEYRYQVNDAAGRTVLSGNFKGSVYSVNIQTLSAGVYSLLITTEGQYGVRKFLKIKGSAE